MDALARGRQHADLVVLGLGQARPLTAALRPCAAVLAARLDRRSRVKGFWSWARLLRDAGSTAARSAGGFAGARCVFAATGDAAAAGGVERPVLDAFVARRRSRPRRRPPSTAALIAMPPPTAARRRRRRGRRATDGSGIAPSAFSAPRWARWLRAKLAHSSHSRRCARSAPFSLRGSRPSSWREIASSASWQVIAVLELLAQGAAGAEDQRLDGADARLEDLGDLLVAAALELAHDER